MPKGKVFWRSGELVITWEKVKMGRTVFVQPTSVKDQNIIIAMMPIEEGKKSVVEVELNNNGTVGVITFISNELTEIVAGNEQEQARIKELQIQKTQEIEANANRENQILANDFHNPYNFVPAIPRNEVTGELGDREPCGHDRFYTDHYSGKLAVKLTTETPLILLDTARMNYENNNQHKSYPIKLDADGNPQIQATAVKGMLRSAYEIITNSRMSIFSENGRLAFRMNATPQETTKVFPAIIVKNGSDLKVKVLKQNNQKQYARLKRYQKNGSTDLRKGEIKNAERYVSDSEIPKHNDEVWVELDTANPHAWVVTKIDNVSHPGWRKGWVYATGANIKNKKYEKIFIDSSSGNPFDLGDLGKDWKDLISNYQKVHEKELQKREKDGDKAWDYLGDKPSKTAWSRQVYEKDSLNLEDGTLCYAYCEDGEIKALLPVIISRRIFPEKPLSLLPEELHPAESITQLSPADRVFGWVNQKGKGAFRGQLRVGTVKCLTEKTKAIQTFDGNLPLNILGQPKPQQGRFYVAKDKDGNAQVNGLNNENAGYNLPLTKGLRGRKVYPHHAKLPDNYWFEDKTIDFEDVSLTQHSADTQKPRFFREYLRPVSDKQRDSQNRSIGGWVKPDTEFTFDLHFTNLSEVELGALIWLLKLSPEHFHRFGGGKPFGFGSVRLELDETQSDIRTGKELAEQRYDSLDGDTPKCENIESNFIEEFVTVYKSAGYENIIESFISACKGFDDELPIHYPRNQKTPSADGKNFDWFVANNKNDGRKLSLPDLSNEIGLPIDPTN